MQFLLDLLREVPFATDEVPLISDEVIYPELHQLLNATEMVYTAGNTALAGLILSDFEMSVMDACIGVSPAFPNPMGPGTGIAQTSENPACCKLLVDAEYVGVKLGIFQPRK